MKKAKIFTNILLASVLLLAQVTVAFTSPAFQELNTIPGTVQRITLETDPNSGVVTVLVTLIDANSAMQTVRTSQETAQELGLLILDEDGSPLINEEALGLEIEIDPITVIPDEQRHNSVANALATFFSDVSNLDYDTIMEAHADGTGFG